MNYLKTTLFFLTLAVFSSCDKKDKDDIVEDPAVGQISGQVMHHEVPIPDATVYIKYGATEFPGTDPADYDDQVTTTGSNAFYKFSELEPGSYYLFGIGYDEACFCEVIGGIPVYLDKDPPTIETNIPVTE